MRIIEESFQRMIQDPYIQKELSNDPALTELLRVVHKRGFRDLLGIATDKEDGRMKVVAVMLELEEESQEARKKHRDKGNSIINEILSNEDSIGESLGNE